MLIVRLWLAEGVGWVATRIQYFGWLLQAHWLKCLDEWQPWTICWLIETSPLAEVLRWVAALNHLLADWMMQVHGLKYLDEWQPRSICWLIDPSPLAEVLRWMAAQNHLLADWMVHADSCAWYAYVLFRLWATPSNSWRRCAGNSWLLHPRR